MHKLTLVGAIAAVYLSGASGVALADNHSDANLADIWFVEVKDGMDEQFREAFQDHIKYRAKKDDPRKYRTYVPVIGDKMSYYAVRYCCFSWQDMDAYGEWASKAKAGDHWNDNVDQYVKSYRHHIQTVDFQNSNWPEDDDHFQLFGVTTYKHKMGRNGNIEAAKAALANAAKEGDWPRHWAFLRGTGGRNSLELVTPFSNYADMAPPEENFFQFLARNHGNEQAQQMLDDWTDNFHGTSYTVYRYLPDMSMDAD